jgi:hypothetical protein
MQPTARIRLTNYPYSALSKMTYNQGEIVYDETNGTLRLLDGVTAGGIALANQAWTTNAINQAVATGANWPVANTTGAQGPLKISIGRQSGATNKGDYAISLGSYSGNINQGGSSIAIGNQAGYSNQSIGGIAIGGSSAALTQGFDGIAIGSSAGSNSQGQRGVAVGEQAGSYHQGEYSIAIGTQAGGSSQGANAIAMGQLAGWINQGDNAVAIGNNAGELYQGANAVAIGKGAGAFFGYGQAARTIILNASGQDFSGIEGQTDRFYVNPVRTDSANIAYILNYNPTTKEITYSSAPATTTSALTNGSNTVTLNSQGELKLNNGLGEIYADPTSNSITISDFGRNVAPNANIRIGGDNNVFEILYGPGAVRRWTFATNGTLTAAGNITTPGSITAASATIGGVDLKRYVDSKVWLALAVGL